MTFFKVIKKRTNVPSFNRGDSPLPLDQSALHSFGFHQGAAGAVFSKQEVAAVFVEASGEGRGIGLDMYCSLCAKF